MSDVSELKAEIELLQGTVGRLATSDSTYRRATRKHYEAQRKLENAIRHHVSGACKCRSTKQCMSKLARLVPVNPRPVYGKRMKAKVTTK